MRIILLALIIAFSASCQEKVEIVDPYVWNEIEVKISAYNSLRSQTSSNPSVAAWGDSLKPGMYCIAVSRDLLKLGLRRNTPVKIEGLDSIYFVKDKMHRRKRKQIDIYMGEDVKSAKEWGIKHLKIKYGVLRRELKDSLK